jgi:hypothetical protein
VFTDERGTEVEVLFEAAGEGTRVTLEHRGLELLPPAVAARIQRFGWRTVLGWFHQYMKDRDKGHRGVR